MSLLNTNPTQRDIAGKEKSITHAITNNCKFIETMKKLLLIFFAFLLIVQSVHAQVSQPLQTKSAQELHDDYFKKYKSYRTTGRILLGSGIAVTVIGGIIFASYAGQGYNGPAPVTAEALFFIVGPAVTLTSIPFFISAKKNKTKAELVLKNESIMLNGSMSFNRNYAALSLKIRL